MSDAARIGKLAAEVMEIAEAHEGDATVGVVAVVVEVNVEEPDQDPYTNVFYRCSDQRRWIQAGLFDSAKRAVLSDGQF